MKEQKRAKKSNRPEAESRPTEEVKAEPTPAPHVTHLEYPPPEMVLRDAMEEPDRRLLEEYADAIKVLRDDKRFTFREIAEWLQGYGIECDHNSVYREYTKGLSEEEEREIAYRNAEEEEERL
jgi:hypothetical protein